MSNVYVLRQAIKKAFEQHKYNKSFTMDDVHATAKNFTKLKVPSSAIEAAFKYRVLNGIIEDSGQGVYCFAEETAENKKEKFLSKEAIKSYVKENLVELLEDDDFVTLAFIKRKLEYHYNEITKVEDIIQALEELDKEGAIDFDKEQMAFTVPGEDAKDSAMSTSLDISIQKYFEFLKTQKEQYLFDYIDVKSWVDSSDSYEEIQEKLEELARKGEIFPTSNGAYSLTPETKEQHLPLPAEVNENEETRWLIAVMSRLTDKARKEIKNVVIEYLETQR